MTRHADDRMIPELEIPDFLDMSHAISVTSRTSLGRQATQVRERGSIPGVVYGPGTNPQPIEVPRSTFWKVYRDAGKSSLIDLTVDQNAPIKALIQEVQPNPVTMEANHVDFRLIRMDQEITLEVPLVFVGESAAVKGLAGTLIHPMTKLTVTCLPANLPHEIEVDLSVLKTFDDVISVATLALPTGVKVVNDPSVTIAVVKPPLTEEQLKKMEEEGKAGDVTTVKTEAEEKKAAEEAKKAEEAAVAEPAAKK